MKNVNRVTGLVGKIGLKTSKLIAIGMSVKCVKVKDTSTLVKMIKTSSSQKEMR